MSPTQIALQAFHKSGPEWPVEKKFKLELLSFNTLKKFTYGFKRFWICVFCLNWMMFPRYTTTSTHSFVHLNSLTSHENVYC